MPENKKRFIAIQPKELPITIIYDTMTESPLVTAPKFGYESLLDTLNKNAITTPELTKEQWCKDI